MQAQAKNVLMLAAVIASSAIAAGQSAPPSADAYTFAGAQNKNFGTEPNLNLALGETSYIKFDLSGAPEGASVK